MNHPVLLVPHQEIYLQSWKNFPEIRWHMLVTGFGGGKTRANVILTLMLVRELQGLKDRAGDYGRLCVAGYTLSHLEKTFLLYFRSYLNASKTEYREDTKNHIFYVGTVTVIFLAMEQPDLIFGQDVVACFDKLTKVLTRRQKRNILEVCIENVKEGDEVLTRQGWKKVLAVHDNGWKDCINVRGTWVTPDHKFATGDEWIEAKDITDSTPLYKYSLSEVKAWQNVILGRNLLLQMSRSWMESGTIDTRILPQAINAIITGAKSIRHITWLCGKRPTESCLKDVAYIIRTSTALITASTICSCLQLLSTTVFTLRDSKNRDSIGPRKEEESCLDMLRSLLLNEDVRKFVPGAENNIQETSNPYTVLKCAEMLPAEINRKLRELSISSSEYASTAERSTELSAPGPDSAVRCAMMLTNMPTDLPLLRKERQEFVLSAERSSSAQDGHRHRHALRTARTSREVKRCHVYDLTVEGCHEYFADRRLVHNCIQEESDELPEATLIEACKALSERTRQQIIGFRSPFICLGTTSQGESGLYRLYCQFKKKGTGFVLIRGRTQDNFYLPKEQIIDLYKMYDDTERRVFLEGEFLAVSRNRVFPGFDWARNYSDDDFDKYLKPGERVFIGMDFNASYNRASAWVAREGVMHCIAGDVKITTLRGDIPMRDVLPGDYVLTRKGYKRVLTKMDQGDKIVYDFGRIRCTPDHVAITPEGDTQVCKAKQFYCLKEQSTEELKKVRDGEAKLLLLKKCFGSARYGEDTRKPNAPLTDIILNTLVTDTQLSSMWKSMQDLLERYLSDGMSTTRTDQMTTDLRALSVSAQENTHDSTIQKKRNEYCQNVCWKDEEVISSLEKLAAACAERLSQLLPSGLSTALSAGSSVRKNGHTDGMSIIENVLLTELVMCAEKLSEELQSRSVALSIDTEPTPAASNQGFERVYDIEVEDCHEFFANGILVHNCVKSYDFPDASDSPDVFRYDFPDQDVYWIPDVTTKDSYPQYARALRKNNIHIIHRSKNPLVEDTAFLVSVLCKNSRIVFHKMAREAADSIARAVRDKDGKIGKGKAPSDWQHYADGVRYACSYMALVLPDFRDIRQSLITHIASLRREVEKDETPPVRKLAAGYTQIDPAAFFKK